MNHERDEFNEYGVKTNFQNSKQKTSSNPKLSLIIAITVLFSIFNFIVGYMIGKFLGNPTPKPEIQEVKNNQDISEITGIPTPPKDNKITSSPKLSEDIILDLEEDNGLIDKTPPPQNQQPSTPQKPSKQESLTKQEETPSKTIKQPQEKKQPSKDIKTSSTPKTSPQSIKYFIQVSSNEKKEVAEATLKKLKSNGLNAFIQETTLNGKKIYRVRVGYFTSYEDAMKNLEKVRKISTDAFLAVSK